MDKSLSFVAQSYRSMGSTSKKGNLKVLVDHATDVARSFKNVIRKSVEVVVTHPNNRVWWTSWSCSSEKPTKALVAQTRPCLPPIQTYGWLLLRALIVDFLFRR